MILALALILAACGALAWRFDRRTTRVLAARTKRLIERCAQRGSSAHNSGQYEISSVDVRTLAHELKNELHPLRMLVSMLEDPTEPHAELLPLMRRAVERMCNQVDGILDHGAAPTAWRQMARSHWPRRRRVLYKSGLDGNPIGR